MGAEDVSVSRTTGLLGWFLGPRDLVFVNVFWGSSSLCRLKISPLAVELGFEDDFWDTRDSFFVNGLSVRSSLFGPKMSASAVELGFLDDFWVPGTLFSSTVSEAAVVCVDWRFQRQPLNWVSRMFFGTPGTQFSSTVCLLAVVYLCRRCQRQP
jgi:hypothetical protein